ncbi:MAG: hypothetical protein GEEBNDBF_01229 [bacterium]|nr:hypothetical protein [bacterium]
MTRQTFPAGSVILLLLLSAVAAALVAGCTRNSPERKESAKAGKIEAKFTPENPHYPKPAVRRPDNSAAAASRTYWNRLTGVAPQPLPEAERLTTPLLQLPWGCSPEEAEALLPTGWSRMRDPSPPLYPPTLTGFETRTYGIQQFPGKAMGGATITLGYHQRALGEQRILLSMTQDGGDRLIASGLWERYGPTSVDREQAPDDEAQMWVKAITLDWPDPPSRSVQGWISLQARYEGHLAGTPSNFLSNEDRCNRVSLVAMSPSHDAALRKALGRKAGGTTH